MALRNIVRGERQKVVALYPHSWLKRSNAKMMKQGEGKIRFVTAARENERPPQPTHLPPRPPNQTSWPHHRRHSRAGVGYSSGALSLERRTDVVTAFELGVVERAVFIEQAPNNAKVWTSIPSRSR